MGQKKKFVLVGTGGRSELFFAAIATDFREMSELVAFCDVNQTRIDYANELLTDKYDYPAVRTYKAEEFDRMIEVEKPDSVIVTSVDRTHHRYMIRAMELGCDVVTEKPMTVDEKKCQDILDAEHEDGYLRDQNVFGDGISIEDTMGVIVRYKNNAILTYSLNAYMPWEGYRIPFTTGSTGRRTTSTGRAPS